VRRNPHEMASRLSYFLWTTMPDAGLFAAADAGGLQTAQRVPVDMKVFLEQTVAVFRLEPAGAGRTISVSTDGRSEHLYLDSARLRQALLALFRNAAEASPLETPIVLSVTTNEKWETQIVMSDRGRGIPSQVAEEISRPNDTRATPPSIRALGLGLETCRVVAEAHGGRLSAEAPGLGGTSMALSLAATKPPLWAGAV